MMQNHESPQTQRATWIEILAVICAIVAMSPAFCALWNIVLNSQQLRDAIVALVVAGLIMAIEYDIRPHFPKFTKYALFSLGISYACLFSAKLFGLWGAFVGLFGATTLLATIGFACFDKKRYVIATSAGFYAFTILAFAVKIFDLPLRVIAGKLSVGILHLFNNAATLYLIKGQEPQIAMNVSGACYLVATECNGFGIISSCTVLSVFLAFFRKNTSLIKKISLIVISVITAFLSNALRITAIVLVAPLVGKERYFFWHEVIGYATFAITLIIVWIICSHKKNKKKA